MEKGQLWIEENIWEKRSEGCIAVEMELAGLQSACDFYRLELYNFLEAGDVLGESSYEDTGLYQANHDLFKLHLALKMLERI